MATASYKTIRTYTAVAGQTTFNFALDYLRKTFILLKINGVEKTYGDDYTVTEQELNYPAGCAEGDIVVIQRQTTTDRLVAWADASVLRASDLTLFEVQLLHLQEETSDAVQTNAADEADRAEAQANRAQSEADRAETEADKAKTEADRAKTQADTSAQDAAAQAISEVQEQMNNYVSSASTSASDAAASKEQAALSASDAAASAQQAATLVSSVVLPPGTYIESACATAPSGYLLCDGSAVSRTTYAALFTAIGTTYGSGDGSTTFNLPDRRDRFALAKGSNYTSLGTKGGEINHILTANEMPSHGHGASAWTDSQGNHTHSLTAIVAQSSGSGGAGWQQEDNNGSASLTTSTAGAHGHNVGVSIANTGGGAAHNNMPPYIVVNIYIKY